MKKKVLQTTKQLPKKPMKNSALYLRVAGGNWPPPT